MIHQLGDKTVIRDGYNWIADNAKVIGNVHLKNNSSVWFGAVLRGDIEKITIGEGSNVQDNSVLHTDPGCPVNIGSGVTIGHLVMLHGCTIEDDTLIGIGAVILNKAVIGKNCIIGANALITENKKIPDNSLVIGSPGKLMRQLQDQEIKAVKENAKRYVNNWKNFQKNLK
ncbi:MAG: gamma carbonic anhydrase family protein [Candidatus Pelagibacter sp.]|nr:gamma carbonic anhydrase family protein [Candidatus Pelagibacter sp.]|tara:strand:+ start:9019 stop:9531 length:513 start_codon:yes stop_codon:yes gene_type:complete